jgi:Clp protease
VDRDYIMSAEQAVEYGMIDRVVSSRELAPQPVTNSAFTRLPVSQEWGGLTPKRISMSRVLNIAPKVPAVGG